MEWNSIYLLPFALLFNFQQASQRIQPARGVLERKRERQSSFFDSNVNRNDFFAGFCF